MSEQTVGTYLYKISPHNLDITKFRKNQYDDFRISVFDENRGAWTTSDWMANRAEILQEYVLREEEDKRELAKKRTPAKEFQKQIKFDEKACPLRKPTVSV